MLSLSNCFCTSCLSCISFCLMGTSVVFLPCHCRTSLISTTWPTVKAPPWMSDVIGDVVCQYKLANWNVGLECIPVLTGHVVQRVHASHR
ncbi:hypothetical protein CALVIDRAFT_492670 [Calocera viscosa TUFC12733]|uniref:Secreted protein n=1 Tax=Calocera viscosa (strain TUFC12733) TaxID=1330018 RepID=A0A167RPB7_CALVF|nr:hypothetical protein CALVIDRAFT_492670 [Calocera viscosa TUFC12733]